MIELLLRERMVGLVCDGKVRADAFEHELRLLRDLGAEPDCLLERTADAGQPGVDAEVHRQLSRSP